MGHSVEEGKRKETVTSVTSSTSTDESDDEKREQWGGTLDFILSCIGYAVGLGNLVRFPYICGRNGGATFLIPYVIMMTFAGLPAFYLELTLGQFSKVSPYILYRRMCPIFSGLGQTMILISVFTGIYYNVYMAWALRYMVDCIVEPISGNPLPFAGCTHTLAENYNSEYCLDTEVFYGCFNQTATPDMYYWRGECHNATAENWTDTQIYNATYVIDQIYINESGVSPSQEYKYGCLPPPPRPPIVPSDYLLGHPADAPLLSVWGWPKWDLVIALAAAWVLVFGVLSKGVKSSGKVVYFTATFPYVLLVILLVNGNLLENSEDGILFYMDPDVDKLTTIQPWTDAASQIFFSLSVGGGGLTTLSTYNDFSNNLLRDTLIVVFGNCLTSFFAGFVIFPILGYEAAKIYPNMDVKKRVGILAAGGPSLAYVAYPGALAQITPPWLWSFLFFFMLILLGIDSELVIVEVVITMVVDQFPILKKTGKIKMMTTAGICFVCFLAGLILVTPSGVELINIIDTFAGGWTLLIAVLFEIIMVAWVYGFRRFVADIHCMLGYAETPLQKAMGYPVNFFWWFCWLAVTPALLTFILGFSFAKYSLKFAGKTYPKWGEDLGFGISAFIVVWIPILALVSVYIKFSHNKPWSWLIRPTLDWGPPDKKTRNHIMATHPYYNGEKGYGGFRKGPSNLGGGDNMFGRSGGKIPDYNVNVLSVKHLDERF